MLLHRVTLLSAMLLCEFSACLTEIIYLQDCHSISPHGVWPTCTGVITENISTGTECQLLVTERHFLNRMCLFIQVFLDSFVERTNLTPECRQAVK